MRRRHQRIEVDPVQDQPRRRLGHHRPEPLAVERLHGLEQAFNLAWIVVEDIVALLVASQLLQEVVEGAVPRRDQGIAVRADLGLVVQIVLGRGIVVGVLYHVFDGGEIIGAFDHVLHFQALDADPLQLF
jgi:hypothetical protein